VHRDSEGNAYGFRGVFHSATPPERIIQTFEFLGAPGYVSIESVDFEELEGGRTRATSHAVYPTMEARDAMIDSGMEGGVIESYNSLDRVLAELQQRADSK
jgi:uncharacterized protein YndB with AHSA1/START domain